MPEVFQTLDLLRELHARRQEPQLVMADCEDCGAHKPCHLFTVGPTAPDGGEAGMAICEECRAAHEALEVTP